MSFSEELKTVFHLFSRLNTKDEQQIEDTLFELKSFFRSGDKYELLQLPEVQVFIQQGVSSPHTDIRAFTVGQLSQLLANDNQKNLDLFRKAHLLPIVAKLLKDQLSVAKEASNILFRVCKKGKEGLDLVFHDPDVVKNIEICLGIQQANEPEAFSEIVFFRALSLYAEISTISVDSMNYVKDVLDSLFSTFIEYTRTQNEEKSDDNNNNNANEKTNAHQKKISNLVHSLFPQSPVLSPLQQDTKHLPIKIGNDPLQILNILETIEMISSTPWGLRHVFLCGILPELDKFLKRTILSTDRFHVIFTNRILQFVGRMSQRGDGECGVLLGVAEQFRIVESITDALFLDPIHYYISRYHEGAENLSIETVEASITAAASIATTTTGLMVILNHQHTPILGKTKQPLYPLIEGILESIFDTANRVISICGMQALTTMLREGRYKENTLLLKKIMFETIPQILARQPHIQSPNLILFLMKQIERPFEEVRHAIFGIFFGVASHPWGVHLLLTSPGKLIYFLFTFILWLIFETYLKVTSTKN
eukprot:TRINITY_DN2041_c0_g1_i2.p1 TRINITY_DN2041_c0_g1~~TRINITY_DN2041_c0_g1_i2.p1  ORF type:complete len:537 (-),score=107.99 TRINITY_DN2041_c0_g1_i2:721-2331(-)